MKEVEEAPSSELKSLLLNIRTELTDLFGDYFHGDTNNKNCLLSQDDEDDDYPKVDEKAWSSDEEEYINDNDNYENFTEAKKYPDRIRKSCS